MDPALELVAAHVGVRMNFGVSPLAQSRLDEALGLAVSPGSVRTGAQMAQAKTTAGAGKSLGTEAGAVIGHHRAAAYAEAAVMGDGGSQEAKGAGPVVIGIDGGVGQAGMIVDGDEKAPGADATHGIAPVTRDP